MVPDTTLLQAFLSGHPPSFDTLYERYKDGLYSYIYGRTRHRETADEILQEVFTAFLRRAALLKTDGSLRAYLFQSARNRIIDQARKKRLDLSGELPEPEAPGPGPADRLVEEEERRHLREAVAALPEEQRDVLLLKLYSGLTFEEIAQTTGTSLGTASSRYRLGLRKVKETWERRNSSDGRAPAPSRLKTPQNTEIKDRS